MVPVLLSIKNLSVSVENKKVLSNVNLDVPSGKIHAIMGPNGAGKSSLALTIMGHPNYKILNGQITFDQKDILSLSPDKRAQLGIFLAFQNPYQIEGLSVKHFLRQAYNSLYSGTGRQKSLIDFNKHLEEKQKLLKIEDEFLDRSLNVGFSGGEKKRAEILQLAVFEPKLAILDEIDAGLDIDALKIVGNTLVSLHKAAPEMSFIIITHRTNIFEFLCPDKVYVLISGEIKKSGDKKLISTIEHEGYKF
jgi:Fe-S cluster assembly ATP-binding protein